MTWMVQIRIGKIYIVYAFIALYWHVKVFNMPYFNSYLDKGVQGPPSNKMWFYAYSETRFYSNLTIVSYDLLDKRLNDVVLILV